MEVSLNLCFMIKVHFDLLLQTDADIWCRDFMKKLDQWDIGIYQRVSCIGTLPEWEKIEDNFAEDFKKRMIGQKQEWRTIVDVENIYIKL